MEEFLESETSEIPYNRDGQGTGRDSPAIFCSGPACPAKSRVNRPSLVGTYIFIQFHGNFQISHKLIHFILITLMNET